MKQTIIALGKLKDGFFTQGANIYEKRLQHLEIIEIADQGLGKNPSDKEVAKVVNREGQQILKALEKIKKGYLVSLCIEGKQMNSLAFANLLQDLTMTYAHIVFIIGGSYGLSKEVIDISHLKLSFSLMTFPHQLMRVILLEQLYRAQEIANHSPYHK